MLHVTPSDITLESILPDRYDLPDFTQWVQKLKKYIERTLDSRHCRIIADTKHAVMFNYKGIEVDLLISPPVSDVFRLYQHIEHLTPEQQMRFGIVLPSIIVQYIV